MPIKESQLKPLAGRRRRTYDDRYDDKDEDRVLTKTTLSNIELRKQIASKVDVLGNIIAVAKGVVPGDWKENDVDPESLNLTLKEVLDANYQLLDRILPKLKSVEISTDENDKTAEYDQTRQKFLSLLSRQIDAAAKGSEES